ncbi:hypothetical protein O181_015936 [Austropuccinia psidii MF-1]|uniref:Uncharacterized protein n=1 Tax=Austropuccinia psidii MF-1 TaxID=1389203 RepID=A0A9Q3C0S7_9BASI|nr:hypothetical protein [Austropuccinia psidii MF-1]
MESIVLQGQGEKDQELVEKPNYFIHRPEERAGNDLSFEEGRTSGINQLQANFRSVQIQAQRSSEEADRSKEQLGKRQRQIQLALTFPHKGTGFQIRAFSCGQCIQYVQNPYGIHSQGAGKDEKYFSTQIMDEMKHIKSSIDVQLGKFVKELKKLTSNINYLRKNHRTFTDWYRVTDVRLDSISNTCDIIVRKFQVQND